MRSIGRQTLAIVLHWIGDRLEAFAAWCERAEARIKARRRAKQPRDYSESVAKIEEGMAIAAPRDAMQRLRKVVEDHGKT